MSYTTILQGSPKCMLCGRHMKLLMQSDKTKRKWICRCNEVKKK